MVILTTTLASIGTAGVPGSGVIMLAMVLQSVGLPLEGIALVAGVDRILDMARTTVNITGDAACTICVDAMEKRKEARRKVDISYPAEFIHIRAKKLPHLFSAAVFLRFCPLEQGFKFTLIDSFFFQ